MILEKLHPELVERLADSGITELNDFQSKFLDAIKSGKHSVGLGYEGSGKSLSLIIGILLKINKPEEGSPRAIVICPTVNKAVEMHKILQNLSKPLDLTVDLVHDKGNMLQQRNDLFDGTEIIVGTPRRLYEMYIQNGFNVSKMKMFVLDDSEELMKGNMKTQIERILESLPKCQFILTTTSLKDKKLESYLDENLPHYELVEADA